MKRLCLLAIISVLVLTSNKGICGPVLISVELPGMESKKAWHQLAIPTYELIDNTAIAETEESQISALKQKGYPIEIIDRQPDLSKYVMVSNYDKAQELKDVPIWQSERTALVKIESKDILNYKGMKDGIRPINKQSLVDRFWSQVLTTNIPCSSLPVDPIVQDIVDSVNTDSIASYISRLVAFYTRFSRTDSGAAAGQWIHDKFTAWGYPAVFDTFYVDAYSAGYDRNVIGSSMGMYTPTREIIIGGHYDSYGSPDPSSVAPGADDDATGTAVALEAARVCRGISFEPTIRYFGFGCEELGLYGSTHYANAADSQNTDIGAVLNSDMLGWGSFGYITGGTEWLRNLLAMVTAKYVPTLVISTQTPPLCDALPFYNLGYPAVMSIESRWTYNIYINSVHDSIVYLDPLFYTANIKAQIATMAVLGRMPGPVNGVVIRDAGTGSHLFVQWSPRPELDVQGYKLLIGSQSGIYSDSIYVSGRLSSSDTIDNLKADSTCFITIWAMDKDGYSSCYATEFTGIPQVVPKAPANVCLEPIDSGIALTWNRNYDLDLAGYRIYRRTDSLASYDSLNAGLTLDTTYTDKPLGGDNKYYYYVKAIDYDGNSSPGSDTIPGRPITMDQGILLVDETDDMPYGGATGDTSAETSQDSLYHYVLGDNQYREYEYNSGNSKPEYIDYTPYGMVIWVADDYSELLAWECLEGLKKYLDIGGRLLLAGWKPSMDLRDTFTYPYPVDFGAGTFIHDYLRISRVEISTSVDSFLTARGLLNYPGIPVDAAKYPVNTWGGTLRYVELLTPVAPAEGIYSADFKNDNSVHQNKVCGVRYLGDDYKTCYLGYPLYYMEKDQVKILIERVLDDFNGVQNDPLPVTYVAGLQQNAPNPFSQYTAISYQLEKPGLVNLKIYNITGQLVKILDDGYRISGAYSINWDGRDESGLKVSSGVYIYHLNIGNKALNKKMTILK